MIEKTLIKIDWKDIKKHFPKAMRSAILVDIDRPHIVMPTASQTTFYTNLFVRANEVGFLNFELVWENNYQIEVDL